MHDHFQQVLGKVFAPYATSTNCMALALERKVDNTDTFNLIDQYFYRHPIPKDQLDINPDTLFGVEEKTITHTTRLGENDWVLLIERSVPNIGLLDVYKQMIQADYIAIGIGLKPGAIDIEPAMMTTKYVVIHNKRQGKFTCLKGKPQLVDKDDLNDTFFIATGKSDSSVYVVYEIDHTKQPPIMITNSTVLSQSEHHGYDTRFVKLCESV